MQWQLDIGNTAKSNKQRDSLYYFPERGITAGHRIYLISGLSGFHSWRVKLDGGMAGPSNLRLTANYFET